MDRPALLISHAHADNSLCDQYASALRARGFDVWYDRDDLQSGRVLSAELERELERRRALVLLVSEASNASYWVRLETSSFHSLAAHDPTRVLLPVRIGPCDVPVLLRGLTWIDGVDRPVEAVADEIAQALTGRDAPPPRPAPHVSAPTPASAAPPTATQTLPFTHVSMVRAASTAARTMPVVPPRPLDVQGLTLAIANQKGGVGKTTTAINLAAYLANAGRKTLVIDLDPQSNTTTGLGVDPYGVGLSIYELLVQDDISPRDVIRAEVRPNLSLLPAKVDLYAATVELVYIDNREYRLKRILEPLKCDYDVMLIDCPSGETLLNSTALTAADGILVPIQCDYTFSGLDSIFPLFKTAHHVRARFNPDLFLFGVVLTMYDRHVYRLKEAVEEISEVFAATRFQTIIPRNLSLEEAPCLGLTVLEHDGRSDGALAYKDLAKEIIARLAVMAGGQP